MRDKDVLSEMTHGLDRGRGRLVREKDKRGRKDEREGGKEN